MAKFKVGDVYVVMHASSVGDTQRVRAYVYRTGCTVNIVNPLGTSDWISPDDLT